MDADERDMSAVLVQGESYYDYRVVQGESYYDYRVVQMLGRALTATECKCCLIERLLLCAVWAVKRLAPYTTSTSQVYIVLPRPERALCA